MNKPVFVSTDTVEPLIRTEFWREIAKHVYDTTSLRENELLRATIKSRRLGALLLAETTFNAQRYVRDRYTIARGGLDDYLLQVVLSGPTSGEFGKTAMRSEVGDIFIVDLAQTVKSQALDGARLTVGVPRQLLAKLVGRKNLHGVVLKAQSAMTGLLTDYLRGLYSASERLAGSESLAAQEAILALLSGALAGKDIASPELQMGLQSALRDRVLDYIDQHLTDHELSPELLIQRFRVSRSYLYQTFEEDGGIARIIRERRLDLAWRKLLTAPPERTSIKKLAFDSGFASSEHFIRLFKQRFGVTPATVKAESMVLPNDVGVLNYYYKMLREQGVP